MPQVYQDRLNACNKLESAETALLKTATEIQAKKNKELAKNPETSDNVQRRESLNVEGDAFADKLVPRDQRPTHRLPLGFLPFSLPLIGTKVDSIDWAKGEIERTNEELTEMQRVLAKEVNSMTKSSRLFNMSLREMAKELDKQTYPPLNSAFILFNNQMAAHMAVRLLTHHEPYRMANKYIDVSPEDIVWDNLSMNPYEAQVRRLISYGITAALVSSFVHSPAHTALTLARLSYGHSQLRSSARYQTSQSCVRPTIGSAGFVSIRLLLVLLVVSSLRSCSPSSWRFSLSSSVFWHASRAFPSEPASN